MLHLPNDRKRGKTASLAVVSLLVTLLLASSLFYSNVSFLWGNYDNKLIYAQTSNSNKTGITTQGLPGVKITSPSKGEQVPIGKDLLISGISASNATSDCKVSVKVNGISPYHDVLPNGGGGKDDYSKWNFTLTPAYTTIKEGQNKITAKYSCTSNPNLVLHNSVNVTGVTTAANNTTTTGAGKQLQQKFSSEANNSAPSVLPLSSSNIKTLSISTNITKNPIIRGDRQNINITVSDALSSERVIGATVYGKIMDSNGVTNKVFRDTTDANGQVSYSWLINKATRPGLFVVQYNVTADGYKPNSATSSFKVQAEGGGVGSGSVISSSNDHHRDSSTGSTGKTSDKGETGKSPGVKGNGHQGEGKGNKAGRHGLAKGKGKG